MLILVRQTKNLKKKGREKEMKSPFLFSIFFGPPPVLLFCLFLFFKIPLEGKPKKRLKEFQKE